jgi:hypothetical protein
MEINVEQNIKKARRTTYSLMASGLHGHNGLDAETSLQLFKTYVLSLYEELLWCHLLVVRLFGVNSDFVDQKSIVYVRMHSNTICMYVNPLLDRLNLTCLGAKIDNIICNTSACADDITLNSFNEMEAQVLIDTAAEYAKQERYQLQQHCLTPCVTSKVEDS